MMPRRIFTKLSHYLNCLGWKQGIANGTVKDLIDVVRMIKLQIPRTFPRIFSDSVPF